MFAGGCTLEAAEQVAEADLDTLQALLEKSLLLHTTQRYWMLETIGVRRRTSSAHLGDDAYRSVNERHAFFFARLTDDVQGDDIETWRRGLRELESERDNLRAAVRWRLENGPADECVELVLGVARSWIHSSSLQELEGWLDDLLLSSSKLSERQLARARGQLGYVRTLQGRHGDASEVLSASAEGYREVGDEYELARALQRLGYASTMNSEPQLAVEYLLEATQRYEQSGHDQLAFEARGLLATAMAQIGRPEEANDSPTNASIGRGTRVTSWTSRRRTATEERSFMHSVITKARGHPCSRHCITLDTSGVHWFSPRPSWGWRLPKLPAATSSGQYVCSA